MYIIVPTSYIFDVGGEYESIDAAVAVIKERAGLYADSVKVEKRYVNGLGSDVALVSFLGEKFNIREPIPPKESKPKLSEEEIRCDKRDKRIARILKESKEPCAKRAYTILTRYPGDDAYPSFVLDESGEIMCRLYENNLCAECSDAKEYTFATRGLASLVLAWHAFFIEYIFRNQLYDDPKSQLLQDVFDSVLKSRRHYNCGTIYYVKAVDKDEDTTLLRADDLRLPESYAQGIIRLVRR